MYTILSKHHPKKKIFSLLSFSSHIYSTKKGSKKNEKRKILFQCTPKDCLMLLSIKENEPFASGEVDLDELREARKKIKKIFFSNLLFTFISIHPTHRLLISFQSFILFFHTAYSTLL